MGITIIQFSYTLKTIGSTNICKMNNLEGYPESKQKSVTFSESIEKPVDIMSHLFESNAIAEERKEVTLQAPDEKLQVYISPGDPPISVQIKDWYCNTSIKKDLEAINEALRYLNDLKLARTKAAEILRSNDISLNEEQFFRKLGMLEKHEFLYGRQTISVPPSREWKNCYSKKELGSIRKEMVRWAQYIVDTYGMLRDETHRKNH